MQETKLIFDSRKASDVYQKHGHYRSASFQVPAGHVALVELTTKHDMVDNVVFTAIRTPFDFGDDCYQLENVGKRYRQVECSDVMSYDKKTKGSNSAFTPYRATIWRLGRDKYLGEVFEYRYVLRPGNYYLVADKDVNEAIENCEVPTIVEVSVFPVNHVSEIHTICNGGKDATNR